MQAEMIAVAETKNATGQAPLFKKSVQAKKAVTSEMPATKNIILYAFECL